VLWTHTEMDLYVAATIVANISINRFSVMQIKSYIDSLSTFQSSYDSCLDDELRITVFLVFSATVESACMMQLSILDKSCELWNIKVPILCVD